MTRPTPSAIRAVAAIIKQFAVETKGTASDTKTEEAAYSVAAALGFAGKPADHYMENVTEALSGDALAGDLYRIDIELVDVDEELGDDESDDDIEINENDDDEFEGVELDEQDDLPTEAALKRMNRDDLIAAAELEGVEIDDEADQNDNGYVTKDEIVTAILGAREG